MFDIIIFESEKPSTRKIKKKISVDRALISLFSLKTKDVHDWKSEQAGLEEFEPLNKFAFSMSFCYSQDKLRQ